MSESPVLFSSDDEEEDSQQEEEVLKKFQAMLQGVPPPSSVTMSKLSVTDMLLKYKENESSYGFGLQVAHTHKPHMKNSLTPLVYYLNSSHTSEEIANLSQKVQSRYIYSETVSSCNLWFDSAIKTNSARKRSSSRNSYVLSPGSRLSHLARRRQVFSSANLLQLANSEKRRHIEIKKQDALKSKSLDLNKKVEFEKINSSKRALFQSPDDEETKKETLLKRNLFPSSENRKVNNNTVEVSKWLSQQNFNVDSSRKRRRLEGREGNGNWPRRALTFVDDDSDKSQDSNSGNSKVISQIQLSLHHKSKLLWAVSVTLKENNMTSKDPQFKTCAAALFMICRKNLGKILSSKVEGGTSEKMLNFAREHAGEIFKKLGISKDNKGNENSETRSLCAVDVRNNVNSVVHVDSSKEILIKDDKQTVSAVQNTSRSCVSESSLETVDSKNNLFVSINEKENIDFCENGNNSADA